MADITTFDTATANRLIRMLREHERTPPEIGNRHGRDVSPNAREIRWARTTTNFANPSYPDRGNAVVIEFGDYDGDEIIATDNAIAFEAYDNASDGDKVIALVWRGLLPAESRTVQSFRHLGRWFIDGHTFVKGVSTTTITANGSGSATLYVDGVSRGTFTVYYDWMTGGGNIANGSDIFAKWFDDQQKWIVVGAECGA